MFGDLMSYLNALDEGMLDGIVAALKFCRPNICNKELKRCAREILKEWDDDRFNLWWSDDLLTEEVDR